MKLKAYAAFGLACFLTLTIVFVQAQGGSPSALPNTSPAGQFANSCGVPTTPPPDGPGRQPIFPAGQYPVKLPAVSPLGARNDLPNPYQPGVHWGQLPAGRTWGSTASVSTAPDGTIWVADRCGNSGAGGTTCGGDSAGVAPIMQFDPSGRLLKSIGAGMFVSPHKLSIDKDYNLWLADNGGHQVFKLNRDGQILLTLGKKGVPGTGLDQFDAPTEVAVAPNGDLFIADGHSGGGLGFGNGRIMKFDRSGKFIKTWGRKGMGPGEFDVIHTLAFDSRGRLFVGDRQNNRIQIFDQDGTFITQWYQFGRPSGIYIDTRTDAMYVADSESRDGRTNTGMLFLAQSGYAYNLGAQRGIRIGSARDGSVTAFIPDPCPYPYPALSSMAEGVAVDSDGNVYGADFLMTVRKFVKTQVAPAVRAEMAPTGTLRAGINLGNVVLAQGTVAGADLRGVAIDLSRELGRRLDVPVGFVTYDAAGKMTDALKTGAWDVAFLGVDPTRAKEISFTAPYLEIEGTYLVPADSPIRAIADVDRDGSRVAVGAKSAYDLFLTRALTKATLLRAPTSPEAINMFLSQKLEVVAGVKAALVTASKRLPGTRVIDGRFMTINQGAGVPKGREAAAQYLSAFIEDVKASGFVAASLKKSGVDGEAAVAPPAVK